MDPALANLGWNEEQWNRISSSVSDEAQKARVVAQLLPVAGPEDPSTLAVPRFALSAPPPAAAPQPLSVNSDPELYLTRISVDVELRSHEVTDAGLNAALVMFRRAANVIARLEDSLMFYGRRSTGLGPPPTTALNLPPAGVPFVYEITNDAHNVDGLFQWQVGPTYPNGADPGLNRNVVLFPGPPALPFRAAAQAGGGALGDGVVNAIIAAIDAIEGNGYSGPFACALSSPLFEAICAPAPSLVLPRDRVLPFLQGPLLRSSALLGNDGIVIALAASPVELVMASEISVRFLQQTPNAHWLFRVSERVALRIKDASALQRISRF